VSGRRNAQGNVLTDDGGLLGVTVTYPPWRHGPPPGDDQPRYQITRRAENNNYCYWYMFQPVGRTPAGARCCVRVRVASCTFVGRLKSYT